jgi:hypothetical protein
VSKLNSELFDAHLLQEGTTNEELTDDISHQLVAVVGDERCVAVIEKCIVVDDFSSLFLTSIIGSFFTRQCLV